MSPAWALARALRGCLHLDSGGRWSHCLYSRPPTLDASHLVMGQWLDRARLPRLFKLLFMGFRLADPARDVPLIVAAAQARHDANGSRRDLP